MHHSTQFGCMDTYRYGKYHLLTAMVLTQQYSEKFVVYIYIGWWGCHGNMGAAMGLCVEPVHY